MNTNWTPGPWGVFARGVAYGIETKGFSVVVYGDNDRGREGGVCGRTPQEMKANAALIAAAPELYAALAEILDGDMPPKQARLLAERAIDKARGE